MLRKDSTILGVVIGLFLPALMYGFLTLLNLLLVNFVSQERALLERTMFLVSLFMNLIPLRLYLVSWKLEMTGRGILFVTFILMILFFLIISPIR